MNTAAILRHLFGKECRLALQPAALFFECMACMVLIPDYPYFITFFYATLGIFFICIYGRENRDIEYSALLPVDRRMIVAARFCLCMMLELIMVGATALFSSLRPSLGLITNAAGMVPNAAFLGFAFLLLGVFNLLFFPMYYKDTRKIGVPYTIAAVVFSVGMVFLMGATMTPESPLAVFDGYAPEFLALRIAVLIGGALLYAAMTFLSFRLSVRRFQKEDIA